MAVQVHEGVHPQPWPQDVGEAGFGAIARAGAAHPPDPGGHPWLSSDTASAAPFLSPCRHCAPAAGIEGPNRSRRSRRIVGRTSGRTRLPAGSRSTTTGVGSSESGAHCPLNQPKRGLSRTDFWRTKKTVCLRIPALQPRHRLLAPSVRLARSRPSRWKRSRPRFWVALGRFLSLGSRNPGSRRQINLLAQQPVCVRRLPVLVGRCEEIEETVHQTRPSARFRRRHIP